MVNKLGVLKQLFFGLFFIVLSYYADCQFKIIIKLSEINKN